MAIVWRGSGGGLARSRLGLGSTSARPWLDLGSGIYRHAVGVISVTFMGGEGGYYAAGLMDENFWALHIFTDDSSQCAAIANR